MKALRIDEARLEGFAIRKMAAIVESLRKSLETDAALRN